MDERNAAGLSAAINNINETGDIDPFVNLMAPDMRWSGVSTGLLWRRRTPS